MPVSMVNWAWLRHLPALVPGDGPEQLVGQLGDAFFMAALTSSASSTVGQVEQQHVAGGPLHQGADRRAVSLADDEVAFPVPGHGPVVDLGRAFEIMTMPGICPRFSRRLRGRRCARPVRRQRCSSRRSSPRPLTNSDW